MQRKHYIEELRRIKGTGLSRIFFRNLSDFHVENNSYNSYHLLTSYMSKCFTT